MSMTIDEFVGAISASMARNIAYKANERKKEDMAKKFGNSDYRVEIDKQIKDAAEQGEMSVKVAYSDGSYNAIYSYYTCLGFRVEPVYSSINNPRSMIKISWNNWNNRIS